MNNLITCLHVLLKYGNKDEVFCVTRITIMGCIIYFGNESCVGKCNIKNLYFNISEEKLKKTIKALKKLKISI